MEECKMTPEQSMQLINRMILTTRCHVEDASYRPFLVWGYTTVAVALAVWCAIRATQNPVWFSLWFAIPVVGYAGMKLTRKKQEAQGYVRTPIDRALMCVWLVLAVAVFIVTAVSFVRPIDTLFVVALLVSSGTAVTGLSLRSRVLSVSGLVALPLSVLFLVVSGIDQCLVFALFFVAMMIIPGHILHHRIRKNASADV